MTIKDLYDRYEIMPQLATHMLRTAGIAKIITDGWEDKKLAKTCVTACLLHDMGNMAKFDLTRPLVPITDIDMWRERQQTFWQKYGHEAHAATYAILEELGMQEYSGYLKEEAEVYETRMGIPDFASHSRSAMLVLYADLRVDPTGVVSMVARIDDLVRRYSSPRVESTWGIVLENYIQSLAKVDVAHITESDVIPFFDELLTYTLQ